MNTILHIVRKEFLQLKRDKRILPIVFVAPIFQLIVLGYAANLDVRDIPTIIFDMDRSAESRALVTDFVQTGYFRIKGYARGYGDIDRAIDHGEASIAIVIPRGFAADLGAGHQSQLQIIADGSESNSATIGLSYASLIVARYSQAIVLQKLQRLKSRGIQAATIDAEVRVWYNPELRSRNFMVPGILGLLLMVITLILTSLAVVKEKEVGTMEQLIVTPIRPHHLVIGKLMPFTIIGLVDVVLVLLVASFWFGVPPKGSIVLLFVLCGVFLMTTLGTGLFVSTISRTQQQAMMTAVFFFMLPMIFLSGFVFPIENMPDLIQYLTYALPLRYFFVIIRGLFLKGAGMVELWDQALVLFLFGITILSLSVSRFQKKLG